MATAVQGPTSVELFYSYAHSDEPLCKELQKHLTALKRAGLIRDWYDRKIEPGSEWAAQIQEAMERAGIIMLLISADFLASQYISDVELPFALARHNSGRATVIPVLLRPVEWRDMPFAMLQILPSQARPVTLWPNQDEAFSDIAGRLRELLYGQRLRELAPVPAAATVTSLTQQRALDAAIASSVVVDEPTDLVTMVRTTESGGLKAILRVDRSYSPTSNDVQSKTFELDFPSDPSGKILPARLELALEAPGFYPPRQQKKIRIPPVGDSDVSVFMLTAKRPGTLRLNLEALADGIGIGSRALVTTSVPPAAAQPSVSYSLISFPVSGSTFRPVTAAAVPPLKPSQVEEYTRLFQGILSPSQKAAPPPPPSQQPKPASMPPILFGAKRSNRGVWIGAASSAAVLALVCTTFMWNTTAIAVHRSPASVGPAPSTSAAPPPAAQPSPPPSAIPPRHVDRVPASPETKAAQSEPSAEELQTQKNSLVLLHARADTVERGVDELRGRLEESGAKLSEDISDSVGRLNSYLQAADQAVETKDIESAQRNVDNSEKELSFLEKQLADNRPQ
jgi:hypothetical protein